MEILFASDIHGNELQYFRIFEKAKEFDVLILGGDLCPKNLDMQRQREFIREYLNPRLQELKETAPELKIFLMPGNDDFAGNLDLFQDASYYLLFENKFELGNGSFITGYPYVPITPFRLKDWEKWDMGEENKRKAFELEKSISLRGISTWNNRYENKIFTETDDDSIENDMLRLFKSTAPEKTLYVFHSPPYNTNLDLLYSKEHVGSLAIRMAIEGYQPLLTLHGHIHETVDVSGQFVDRLGDTICASPGNHNTLNTAQILGIQLPSRSVKRIRLD